MSKYLNLKLTLLIFFILISGLSSFRSEFSPPKSFPKTEPRRDTVALVYITIQDGDVILDGKYLNTMFSDQCDVFEVIAKTYVRDCISAKTDTTFHPKTRKL